jgi:acyl-CoA thioesterase-1
MMTQKFGYRFCAALSLAAAVATLTFVPARTQGPAKSVACTAPAGLVHLSRPLSRTARLLAAGKPIKIVAIGSSSTAGAGASSTAATYPNRLEAYLKERFPQRTITVINHGVNGTEARDMIARFDQDIVADHPDLVLWQLGTNSVLRDHVLSDAPALINEGLSKIKAFGVDVILINPQYAPKVLAKPEVEHMVKIIATVSGQANVNLFDRFAVMQHWRVGENMPFSAFLSADELHMNDWSYACVAKLLGGAIAEAATRPAVTATSAPTHN